MSEHERPENQPESAHAPSAKAANEPALPLEQRRVQWTLGFLGLLATLAILWSGRHVMWNDQTPANLAQPTDVLLQIDVNSAEVREFAVLPEVGPILAARIVADREINGPFESVQDLSRVHGIGEKTIARIRMYCIAAANPDAWVALSAEPVN